MKELKPRIEYYRQRNFTEKLNATFDFLRENYRPLLRYSFYIIMPVCLVQTFATNSFYGVYYSGMLSSKLSKLTDASQYLSGLVVMMLCVFVGSALIAGLIYALMQTYSVREDRLKGLVFSDFSANLRHNALRCIGLSLFIFLVSVFIIGIVVALVGLSSSTLFFTIPLLILFMLCLLPLMLALPAYLFERNITLFGAIAKAWKLGVATFWGMLGLMIALYFIASILQTITTIPYTVSVVASNLLSTSNNDYTTQTAVLKFVIYILGLIYCYGMYISMMIAVTGLAFQYFHAREKVEGVTIETNIENFPEFGNATK